MRGRPKKKPVENHPGPSPGPKYELALSLGWTQRALDAIRRSLKPTDRIGEVTGEWILIMRSGTKLRAYNPDKEHVWRRIWRKNT